MGDTNQIVRACLRLLLVVLVKKPHHCRIAPRQANVCKSPGVACLLGEIYICHHLAALDPVQLGRMFKWIVVRSSIFEFSCFDDEQQSKRFGSSLHEHMLFIIG